MQDNKEQKQYEEFRQALLLLVETAFWHGYDKGGHRNCYNELNELQDTADFDQVTRLYLIALMGDAS